MTVEAEWKIRRDHKTLILTSLYFILNIQVVADRKYSFYNSIKKCSAATTTKIDSSCCFDQWAVNAFQSSFIEIIMVLDCLSPHKSTGDKSEVTAFYDLQMAGNMLPLCLGVL